jgi:SpoVK/Ycf46/Vps4 family AAA+-type ATPase
MFSLQGPELMNKYVGESERAVREVRKLHHERSILVSFFVVST